MARAEVKSTNRTKPGHPWHMMEPAAVLGDLGADASRGLTGAEAAARAERYGPNVIREGRQRSKLDMLFSQFSDFMILLLIAAAILSGFIGDLEDSLVILGIVALNAGIGFTQELRASQAVAALRHLASPGAVVVRDGYPHAMPAELLVPGDVVLLEAGGIVPADLRLLETANLQLGEAALTGESLPVEKRVERAEDPDLPLAARSNMAYKGTIALKGRARGVVVATGMNTELGHIAIMLERVGSTRTPLQQRLTVFGRQIAVVALMICALIFTIGLLRGEPPLLMLLTALSLAVAAIPEALPAVVTVLLALGAARMARAQALIRRLPAVETLGSVTTICSDKTGTLTLNEMRVTDVFIAGERGPVAALGSARAPTAMMLDALALCNDVATDEQGEIFGDPTEVALWRAAAEAGADKAERARQMPRVLELSFDSERRRMTTFHVSNENFVGFTKGAPETVIPCCTTMAMGSDEVPIDRAAVIRTAEEMAADGLRVLAVAYRSWEKLPRHAVQEVVERDLTLLGLVGMLDPPRPEAKEAVATCRAAGIRPVMITGDHPATARAIAGALGILDGGVVMTGRELEALDQFELRDRVGQIQVYARVDPGQKIRIVIALQQSGESVAMTGDGVNDAPALAQADIGVAMGKGGTDVAREAASMVLLDDNFATIVAAVREGRRIYDNIRKFVRFVVTCNSAEIWAIFLAPFFGLPVPLLPIQILWINLVTDGLPGLALAVEPAERGIMTRPPRSPREGLFAGGLAWEVIWGGLLMAAITLLTEALALKAGRENWRTMVFTVLTLVQMWQVMAVRSHRDSLFQQGLSSNLPLLGAVLLTFMLQLVVVYVPGVNTAFRSAPLTLGEFLACIAMSSVIFVVMEIVKWFRRIGARRVGRRLA